jgi:hypothetical protein
MNAAGQPVHRLRLSEAVWTRLRDAHLAPGKRVETMSMLLGHSHRGDDGAVTVVVSSPDDVLLLAPDCFDRQSSHAVVLSREVAGQLNWRAVSGGHTAIVNCHDHHFATHATWSCTDDEGDLADAAHHASVISTYTAPLRPLVAASMLIARRDCAARVVHAPGVQPLQPMRVDRVGLGLRALGRLQPHPGSARHQRLARHRGIVAPHTQALMAELHVVVAGCGGTGSIAAEALARIGIGRITLVDADLVEASNLNRLQGAGEGDIGRPKAEVLAARLRALFPDLQVVACVDALPGGAATRAACMADVLLGCVDDNAARWFLNRLAVQYGIPYMDCGVLVQRGRPATMYTRVSSVLPGVAPCGHCSPLQWFERATPQRLLDPATQRAARGAGYVEHAGRAGDGDPSIYPLNLQAVGTLVQNLLDFLDGGRPTALSVFQRSDRPLVERVDAAAFGGRVPDDCPVCNCLLGRCASLDLPGSAPAVAEPILPTADFFVKE